MTDYNTRYTEALFSLLRIALCKERPSEDFGMQLSGDEWMAVYKMADEQALTGVIYKAIETLQADQRPPFDMLLEWVANAETVSGQNRIFSAEARRLTELFASEDHRSAILKGQANARLYPDPLSRQPGDIDIWVDGGRKNVVNMLRRLGLLEEGPLHKVDRRSKATASYHHVHLPVNEQGVTVEIHFRPSSGNLNPFTNRRLQRWMEQEIQHTTIVDEGFRVPSIRFALIMQLAHIQRHFLAEGIGLRQICDYFMLLRHATEDDRQALVATLRPFGLRHTAGALMWLLGEKLHLESGLMLCEKDARRGEWMLRKILEDGNFGCYAPQQQYGLWRRFLHARWQRVKMMRFDFWEVLWLEINYWKQFFLLIPTRIKFRSLSLRVVPQ